ncbi:MAG TPA: alkaline phosphatase family protein [Pirellulales bacterium]|nr:alkaline phosphatase family protein [Pirellulales bacterium]
MRQSVVSTYRGKRLAWSVTLLALAITGAWNAASARAERKAPAPPKYVIQISCDGLGSAWLEPLLKAGELPNFARLEREGAWTHNARTDYDMTITLPNHTCMLTGRPVQDRSIGDRAVAGHVWKVNNDEQPENLHGNRKGYIASTFDVAHDRGLRTALLATKTKFKIYENSYDAGSGAADKTGDDNGRDKIDFYLISEADSPALLTALVGMMKSEPANYAFVHFHDADQAGHKHNWGSPEYNAAVRAVDGYLGAILDLIENDPRLRGNTAVIVSADHGGFGNNHQDSSNPLNYTIPFYVWGAGVEPGKDLYALNAHTRRDPGTGRPDYTESPQPIRNGDGGNLAMSLLGLPAVPDSLIDEREDLTVSAASDPSRPQ